jgi:hypothetical protein
MGWANATHWFIEDGRGGCAHMVRLGRSRVSTRCGYPKAHHKHRSYACEYSGCFDRFYSLETRMEHMEEKHERPIDDLDWAGYNADVLANGCLRCGAEKFQRCRGPRGWTLAHKPRVEAAGYKWPNGGLKRARHKHSVSPGDHEGQVPVEEVSGAAGQ